MTWSHIKTLNFEQVFAHWVEFLMYMITERYLGLSQASVMEIFAKIVRLTLSWRRSLSYRNHSIDLLSKSMDWFLCDRDLCRERVKSLMGPYIRLWAASRLVYFSTDTKSWLSSSLQIFLGFSAVFSYLVVFPANIYLLKVGNTRISFEICLKLTIFLTTWLLILNIFQTLF